MAKLVYMLLIFAAGLSWPLQAAVNSQLKTRTNQPLAAVLVNGGGAAILAGLAMLLLGVWAGRLHTPAMTSLRDVPWWAYLGGVFSVLVITAQSSAAVPLGAALLVTLFVAGQGISSAIFDQFGLLGFERRPISVPRTIGLAMLIGGAVLMATGTPGASKQSQTVGASPADAERSP